MKRTFIYFLIIVSILVFTESCGDDDDVPGTITIGVLLPLTGTGSSTGESCRAAMDLAETDILLYLQTIGKPQDVDFLLEDSQTDPDVALEKMATLGSMGCRVVVGPYSSAEVLAVKPYCDEQGIIAISPSSVATSLAIAGDNIYRMVPDDNNQAEAMVELLKDDQKKNLVAVIRDDLWGWELEQALFSLFTATGGFIPTVIAYSTNTTDFSVTIDQLSEALNASLATHTLEESAIYMVSFKEGTEIMKLAAGDPILSQVDWYGASAYAQNGTLLMDWTAASFAASHHLACPIFGYDDSLKDKWEPLVARIRAVIGRDPEIYALAVYDALLLTVLTYLSLEGDPDLATFRNAFEQQCNNYVGVTGPTTLNTAGDRSFAVYDFWSMRLFMNDFSWYRSATYKNETGELIRY